MPVGHGTWKASEPLSDPDQLLSIAKHDPNVNAKQVVGVCNTQQRLVHPLPHTFLPYEVPAVFFTRRTTWPHGNRDSSSRSTATRTFFSLMCGFTACSSSLASWLSSQLLCESFRQGAIPLGAIGSVADPVLNGHFEPFTTTVCCKGIYYIPCVLQGDLLHPLGAVGAHHP